MYHRVRAKTAKNHFLIVLEAEIKVLAGLVFSEGRICSRSLFLACR
jgi:hypothetical protein